MKGNVVAVQHQRGASALLAWLKRGCFNSPPYNMEYPMQVIPADESEVFLYFSNTLSVDFLFIFYSTYTIFTFNDTVDTKLLEISF